MDESDRSPLRSRARARVGRFLARLRYLFDRRSATINVGQGRGLRFASGASNPHYLLGDNELPVQNALARYLQRGDVFVDVGANVGFLTVIGARLVGAEGRVYAFEPLPSNAALIRLNSTRNGFVHVEVIEQAVSDHTGTDRLVVAAYSGGAALAVAERPQDAIGEQTVATVTLDDAISTCTMRSPTLVKIDVEGAEIQVLYGMVRTLEESRPIVIYEIDGPDATATGTKAAACRAFLEAYGYEVSRLEDSYPSARWQVEHYLAVPPS